MKMKIKLLIGCGLLILLFTLFNCFHLPGLAVVQKLRLFPCLLDHAVGQIWIWFCGLVVPDSYHSH